jgi:hypothetical protein
LNIETGNPVESNYQYNVFPNQLVDFQVTYKEPT